MPSSPPPAPALDSATLILLRDTEPGGLETLLVQRQARSRAFAGAHVFPGGCVDAGDAAPVLHAASRHLSAEAAAARLGDATLPGGALAFWIAAIRELFEETGILLATREGRALEPAERARFDAHRRAELAGRASFAHLVAAERLVLATHEIEYFGRWITPVTAPQRFDTRFFVARLPADAPEPLHDRQEVVAAEWITPAQALARARAGALVLAPPTVRTLEELHALGSTEDVLAAARRRNPVAIQPKVVDAGGRLTILYPGDSAYASAAPGETLAGDPPGSRDRVVMEAGSWRTIRSGP